MGQHVVGVDDAYQSDPVAGLSRSGHHPCTNQDARFPFDQVGQDASHGPCVSGGIGIHAGDFRIGEEFGGALFDPFRPDAARHQRVHAARGTGGRVGPRPPAVVAHQCRGLFVVGERDVAVRAGRRGSAVGAFDVGRESAAVLEQDDLAALVQRPADPFAEVGGQESFAAFQYGDFGEDVSGRCGDGYGSVFSVSGGVEPAFGRGGRAGEQGLRSVQAGEHEGGVAGVVAGSGIVLPVVGVVFVIDDDQPQLPERQEKGGTGTDDEADAAGLFDHPLVGRAAGAVGEPGVVEQAPGAECGLEGVGDPGGQHGVGQQQERLPSAGDLLCGERYVNGEGGVPGVGDFAAEQYGGMSGEGGGDLRGVWRGVCGKFGHRRGGGVSVVRGGDDFLLFEDAAFDEPQDGCRGYVFGDVRTRHPQCGGVVGSELRLSVRGAGQER